MASLPGDNGAASSASPEDAGAGARGMPENRLIGLLRRGQARRTRGRHAVVRLDIEGQMVKGYAGPRTTTSLTIVDMSGSGSTAGPGDLLAVEDLVGRLALEAEAEWGEASSCFGNDSDDDMSLASLHSAVSDNPRRRAAKTELMQVLQPELCNDTCDVVAICALSPLSRDVAESRRTLDFGVKLRSLNRLQSSQDRSQPEGAAPGNGPMSKKGPEEDARCSDAETLPLREEEQG